jgi:dTDP-4-dehydrorhamnose 3,5-epimerase
LIEGVVVKKLKVIPDERGRLMEILRCDEEIYQKFGQVYMTSVLPGVVKGWHYHKKQFDHFTCINGMIKAVLYDSRKNSPTFGEVNEFFVGVYNSILIKVPPFVFHGFKGIGTEEALVINVPTEPYDYDNPDEFRVDPHNNDIPYNWASKDG